MTDEQPKIFVDSDWKKEAHQEKEKLAQAQEEIHGEELPEPTFLEIVNLIAMQAIVSIGGFQTPDGQRIPANLFMARHQIEMLEILRGKTQGNLTPQEQQILDTTLHEIRLAFVQVTQAGSQPGSVKP
ncbi:MAG: hypothetical protein HJJLKODD_00290 [Phycisphaerae bacterium]|nr:hypothetical protein [Phycisphaerae bacterium]